MKFTDEELQKAVRKVGRHGKTFASADVRHGLGLTTKDRGELTRFQNRFRAFLKASDEVEMVDRNCYRLTQTPAKRKRAPTAGTPKRAQSDKRRPAAAERKRAQPTRKKPTKPARSSSERKGTERSQAEATPPAQVLESPAPALERSPGGAPPFDALAVTRTRFEDVQMLAPRGATPHEVGLLPDCDSGSEASPSRRTIPREAELAQRCEDATALSPRDILPPETQAPGLGDTQVPSPIAGADIAMPSDRGRGWRHRGLEGLAATDTVEVTDDMFVQEDCADEQSAAPGELDRSSATITWLPRTWIERGHRLGQRVAGLFGRA